MSKKGRSTKAGTKPVLADHTRVGKKFIPPMLDAMGDTLKYTRWLDDVLPEVVWIALLTAWFGPKDGARLALTLAKTVQSVVKPQKARAFAFVSEFRLVPEHLWPEIRQQLGQQQLDSLRVGLAPLFLLYPEFPLNGLLVDQRRPIEEATAKDPVAYLKPILKVLLDRNGVQATVVQTTAIYILFVNGVLKVFDTLRLPHLDAIFDYPKTEDSKRLASFVRASINGLVGHAREAVGKDWPTHFWRQGYHVSECEVAPEGSTSKSRALSLEGYASLVADYNVGLQDELSAAWGKAKLDLSAPLSGEVQAALIARQARFAVSISTQPNLWAYDIGRIILRCMVDTHITLTWLIRKGRQDHYERFVEYGLGQEKLLLEHLNARLDESNPQAEVMKRQIEGMEAWINSQLVTWLLPVNVGSWTEKSVRDLAAEADCREIYALAYSPYSTVVHGSWNAVAKLNLRFCTNPLHRLHRVPSFEEPPLLLDTPIEATRVMNKSVMVWLGALGLEVPTKSFSGIIGDRIRDHFKLV